jgi:CRP/FNR family transcriptional regulator
MSCFGCQNRDRTEWCVLAEDDVALIDKSKAAKAYQPGQILYNQGDPCRGIFCIESGTVAIRKMDAEGSSKILRLAHAGMTLGYADYFGDKGYNGNAESLDAVTACFIDRNSLRTLLDHNPALGLRFLRHIAEDLKDAEESSMQQALYTVRIRLAHLLLTLKDHYASVDEDGTIVMSLPMTRQDIAALLGARPETIYRTIQQMETDKVVNFSGHTVIIPDLDLLLDEIEAPSERGDAAD